jgi:DNA-binding response OmpR family regulator
MQGIFISRKLEAQGAKVTVVENGQLALAALEDNSYSAVILDGMMPVMDGFQTLRAIRQTPRLKGIPVIMVTAMGSEEDIIRGYQYGANDYILKPFSEDQLVSRIRSLLVMAA